MRRRFATIIFGTFALVALLLAATVLYGDLGGSVTGRAREIEVRVALGAMPAVILRLVRQGLGLTLVSVACRALGWRRRQPPADRAALRHLAAGSYNVPGGVRTARPRLHHRLLAAGVARPPKSTQRSLRAE
jgi:hypothetical protein